ncbi:porin [Motilimonas sp. 1_MG-2023]|uniref:porin n=1 Tax=Motilimonas sp. 1_MG-2023 TaxID=3062672 RepID=UPI0026E40390|nr:porin [Motilimonas sp. 1_MG-2023]MDO6524931.1 porin [Motilimonas sp. 1_MG-2023]
MFKKTLVAAALATASMGANAYEIGQNNDFNVEVYGVAAISIVDYGDIANDQGPVLENESRIGFRAGKAMTDSIEVFMQIEGGYVDNIDWAHGGVAGGTLGQRDTFIGLKGDWGKVRFGRVLTPMYELIDWPYANPGLGASWDWGGDVAYYYDRQSNTIRYDSPSLGGLTFALAVGRDDDAANAKSISGAATKSSYYFGGNVNYTIADMVTLHGGFETADKFGGNDVDTFGYLLGFEASLPAGFGLAGAFKSGESKDNVTNIKSTQDSYSIIGQYWAGSLGFKLGYTANLDPEVGGNKVKNVEDSIVSGQVMYVVNGFVPYLRVANRDLQGGTNEDTVVRVGLEYGF